MKLRYDLIPPRPLESLAEVYTIGAKKYADRNWEKGIQYGRLFAAMMRHAWKFWRGEERDPVDGQLHLASVAWCAFSLMEYQHTHKEMDDRPYSQGPTIGWVFEDQCTQCGPIPCGEDIVSQEKQWKKDGNLSKLYPRTPR